MPRLFGAPGQRAGRSDTSRSKKRGRISQATTALKGLVVKMNDNTKARRLGMFELGRFAYEERMPRWLERLLREDGVKGSDGEMRVMSCAVPPPSILTTFATGSVEALMRCLAQTSDTESAYFCDPCVRQVFKLKREGDFCGYRNIQMLSSYIIDSGMPGSKHFEDKLPSIFDIQDAIESAWRQGIREEGFIETGGIKGTRKFIGTPEAETLFTSFEIPYKVHLIRSGKGRSSAKDLLRTVEEYFQAGYQEGTADSTPKVRGTSLPPLYLQTPVHSMTIVGIEKLHKGGTNLLVFDPKYHDKDIERELQAGEKKKFLQLYRRDMSYLARYREFELLELTHRKTQ